MTSQKSEYKKSNSLIRSVNLWYWSSKSANNIFFKWNLYDVIITDTATYRTIHIGRRTKSKCDLESSHQALQFDLSISQISQELFLVIHFLIWWRHILQNYGFFLKTCWYIVSMTIISGVNFRPKKCWAKVEQKMCQKLEKTWFLDTPEVDPYLTS